MVTLAQMVGALVWAVETAGEESRVVGVTEIRDKGRSMRAIVKRRLRPR
jgi:hypothetical protein